MIPFIPTIALALVSFLASAFVILRIVIPILPPHPLSRRVPPSEFGLPDYNFRSLTSADKSHLWLTSFDLLALCMFIWQAVSEYCGGSTNLGEAKDPAASARLWFALTIRQSCLLVISGLTLAHIRMGRSVSFGSKHWMIWAPTLFLGLTSTVLSAVLAGVGVPSLFAGLVAYSAMTALLSTASFGGLVYTLVVIKRNLAALNDPTDSWPPAKEVEERPRPSFTSEDIDALREGSSWLTSDAGSSRHETMSNWSFSTHHARRASMRLHPAASQPSSLPRSSYWFSPPLSATDPSIPPVPPLPSPYRGNSSPTCVMSEDPDPFRRDAPSRPRLGSQSSWLTSPAASHVTLSAWSYPTTPLGSAVDLNTELLPHAMASSPATPALSSAKVLGGYGYTADSEKGIASLAVTGSEVDISFSRYVFWLLSIWVPFGLSLPYMVCNAISGSASIQALQIMLVLSVTLSSPLLSLNILVRSPIPIPTALFGVHADPPSVVMRAPSPADTLATYCREYKRSGSVTVVEGRRSGDVWISQGDAVDGRGKVARALGLMSAVPKLAVLPPEEEKQDRSVTPPLPMQEDTFHTSIPPTPQSTNSAELGRMRTESKASSYLSNGEEAFASRIMIAQRHYSALATTVAVPASPQRTEAPDGLLSVATGVAIEPAVISSASSHLRSRSMSSIIGQAITTSDISPPPSEPLPPTPPNVRNAKLSAQKLCHRKSYSSGFSFGAVVNDNMNEIDALTAGLLPLLVPGLKVGEEMKIRDWEFSPPLSSTVTKKKPSRPGKASAGSDFGVLTHDEFLSSRLHSTPAQGRQSHKGRKVSVHKRNHFSLPSLGLGKDAVPAWKNELNRALATKIGQYATLSTGDANRRNTVWGDEAVPNFIAHPVTESETQGLVPTTNVSLGRSMSTRSLGLRVEVPHGMESARTSVATLFPEKSVPPSAASTVTLFEPEGIFEPLAQSTPLDTLKGHPYSRQYQAMPVVQAGSRRPSIVYIKSDGNPPSEPVVSTDRNASSTTLAQWSSRDVKPLKPKAAKLPLKPSTSEDRPTSPGGTLRQLSLLQDRDANKEGDASELAGTRPLLFGKKKQKVKVARDENADPSSANKYLKPLQLGRSESSRLRGGLRKDEVLPSVVVRPPSTSKTDRVSLRVPLRF